MGDLILSQNVIIAPKIQSSLKLFSGKIPNGMWNFREIDSMINTIDKR